MAKLFHDFSALSHYSSIPGIGGKLKSKPEDFVVEEIIQNGTILKLDGTFDLQDEVGGRSIWFVMQKTNWSTSSAISELSRRLGVSQKNFNIAGTKDKLAITTQLCSVYGAKKEQLLSASIKDIKILGTWTRAERIKLGELLGNRFTIRVLDCNQTESAQSSIASKVNSILSDLDGCFPNYFGSQRFGSSRNNTHLIGQKILKGELEQAVISFLCDSGGEANPELVNSRADLEGSLDFEKALSEYPKHMRLERLILKHLSKKPGDYIGALRCLPRNNLLLFIHAFQSYMFNQTLSKRIHEGELELEEGEYYCGEKMGFPDIEKSEPEGWICSKLIGYATPLNEREKTLLESIEMSKEAFRIKALPEIASKGSYRTLLSPLRDFSFGDGIFRFNLQAGSYATSAMREFLDMKKSK